MTCAQSCCQENRSSQDSWLSAVNQDAAKKMAAQEAWRAQYNKEERKKRYVEKGQADARSAKRARTFDE